MNRLVAFLLSVLALATPFAAAHEIRPAYAELVEVAENRFDVRFKVPARGELKLSLTLRLPRSGTTDPSRTMRNVGDGFVEEFRYVAGSSGLAGETIEILGLAATMTDALVRIVFRDGSEQVHRLTAAHPRCVVEARQTPARVAWRYVALGVEHIFFGIDHLLFVLALLLLVRGVRQLITTITAFTVAHSVTLTAAALGWASVPGPPVEAVIALSIVFVASEIVKRSRGEAGLAERRPWLVAFTFGLLHGFGFAGALGAIGLPKHAVPLALGSFNLGVEVGQLVIVIVACMLGAILVRVAPRRAPERLASSRLSVLGAYAIGTIATFWCIERIAAFTA